MLTSFDLTLKSSVPRSSLLQSICYNVPQHPGSSTSLHILVPIRKEILVTIQELLYTGQVNRTKKEIEEVSNGLAILGINDFSSPPQFIHPGITAIPLPPHTVATKQSSGSGTPEFLKRVIICTNPSPPGPSPSQHLAKIKGLIQNNSSGLMIQKIDPTLNSYKKVNETNNNDEEKPFTDGRTKRLRNRREKARMLYSYAGDDSDSEEFDPDGTRVTKKIAMKKRGTSTSRVHECSEVNVKCPDCDTSLRSSWYLPPSRHSCTAVSYHNVSIDTVRDTQEEEQRSRKIRRLSVGSDLISPSQMQANPPNLESSARSPNERMPNKFSCPLKGCSRQCDVKKDLMVHLAFTHYLEKLEIKYITGQPIGKSSLSHNFN